MQSHTNLRNDSNSSIASDSWVAEETGEQQPCVYSNGRNQEKWSNFKQYLSLTALIAIYCYDQHIPFMQSKIISEFSTDACLKHNMPSVYTTPFVK